MTRSKRRTNRLKRRNSRRYSRRQTKNRKIIIGGVFSFPLKKTLKVAVSETKVFIKGVTKKEPFNFNFADLSASISGAIIEDANEFKAEISNIGLSESTCKSLVSIIPPPLRPGATKFLEELSKTLLGEILTQINEFEKIFFLKLDELKEELISSKQYYYF